jgi:hypothetical protein
MKHVQWINRLRGRLAWWLMPSLWISQETRRLEKIAQSKGASRSAAKALACAYFETLRKS